MPTSEIFLRMNRVDFDALLANAETVPFTEGHRFDILEPDGYITQYVVGTDLVPRREQPAAPSSTFSSMQAIRDAEVDPAVKVISLHVTMLNTSGLGFTTKLAVDSEVIVQFVRNTGTQESVISSKDGSDWRPVEPITPQHFGAIGTKPDGTPYMMFDLFDSLDDAQVAFPGADHLNVSVDTMAIQAMFDYVSDSFVRTEFSFANDIHGYFPRGIYQIKNRGVHFLDQNLHAWKRFTGDAATFIVDVPNGIGMNMAGCRKVVLSGLNFIGARNFDEPAAVRVPKCVFAFGRRLPTATGNRLRPADSFIFNDCEFTGYASLTVVYCFASEKTNFKNTHIKNFLGFNEDDPIGIGFQGRSYGLSLDGCAGHITRMQPEYSDSFITPNVWSSFLQVSCDNLDVRHFGDGCSMYMTGGSNFDLRNLYVGADTAGLPGIDIEYVNDRDIQQSTIWPNVVEDDGVDFDATTGMQWFIQFRARESGDDLPTLKDRELVHMRFDFYNIQCSQVFNCHNSLDSVTFVSPEIFVHETIRDYPGHEMFDTPNRFRIKNGKLTCYEQQQPEFMNIDALHTFSGDLYIDPPTPNVPPNYTNPTGQHIIHTALFGRYDNNGNPL